MLSVPRRLTALGVHAQVQVLPTVTAKRNCPYPARTAPIHSGEKDPRTFDSWGMECRQVDCSGDDSMC